MANRFKQAAPKAKRLYKTGRYPTFAAAMKAALKKSPARKRKVVKKRKSIASHRVKRKSAVRKKKSPVVKYRRGIELNLGKAYVDYFKANTIKATKAASKRMKAYKKQLKAV